MIKTKLAKKKKNNKTKKNPKDWKISAYLVSIIFQIDIAWEFPKI